MLHNHPLPLIGGVTETAEDTEPRMTRLMRAMSQRSGSSTSGVNEVIGKLQIEFAGESNERLKSRIAAAISLLTNQSPSPRD